MALSGTTALVGTRGGGAAYLLDIATGSEIGRIWQYDGHLATLGASVAPSGSDILLRSAVTNFYGDPPGTVRLYSQVSSVPLPAGLWLLGSALGLLMVARRRSA